jgi:hypothetical protein
VPQAEPDSDQHLDAPASEGEAGGDTLASWWISISRALDVGTPTSNYLLELFKNGITPTLLKE